jgi:hypothetical protein
MKQGSIAEIIGKGLIAGLAGTVAITASTMIESKIRGHKESTTPSKVGGKVLGVRPRDKEGQSRFNTLMHWQYGTAWGLFLSVCDLIGLRGGLASAAHFSAVWGTSLVMLPAADAAKPVTEWEAEEIGIDAMHHIIYAVVAELTYSALSSRSNEEQEDNEDQGDEEFGWETYARKMERTPVAVYNGH